MAQNGGRATIFALATAPGKSAVALVRISGPATAHVLESLIKTLPQPRRASLRRIRAPGNGEIIDQALVSWFPAPNSFTGEDSAEFALHGSRAVISALLDCLGQHDDCRLATPGEFTHRALANGKIDLIEVESLGDLIAAETEQQRRFAQLGMSGRLTKLAEEWRRRVLDALVVIESSLDFSDESDVDEVSLDGVLAICRELRDSMVPWLQRRHHGELIRHGLTVLIAGPPNAGKSTLINALAARDVAIVSEYAGTTRDLLEIRLDLSGYPVNVLDSAGIRESLDPIEQIGVARALDRSRTVDLILWLCAERADQPEIPIEFQDCPLWRIVTKAELAPESSIGDESNVLRISALTGYNMPVLIEKLRDYAADNMSADGSMIVANERQFHSIRRSVEAIDEILAGSFYPEIIAENLRLTVHHLEFLIGKVGVEDVLGEIFSRFCIGK